MNENNLVKILAELGHKTRLSIYKLIMKYGHSGIIIGEVGKQLYIAPSTSKFHLNRLVDAGLIMQAKNGREVCCSANFERLDSAIDLLTSECCSEINEDSY
jgi:predicted transcriptional regulator